MTSTYVNDLRLNEMATGDQSGSWGTVTNTNLELIGEAFGYGTEAITTNADTHTTTIADGATDPARSMFLKYTGTLDSACTITIGPNTVNKLWFIENATSGSQNIIITSGSGANITIPAGQTKAVYSDGVGSGAAMVDAFASLNVVDMLVDDDLTVAGNVTAAGVSLGDGDKATFGDGNDLEISHTGTTSWIRDVGGGDLQIFASDDVFIRGYDTNNYMARFNENGAVTLYHNNSEKLATSSTGVEVTGNVKFPDNGKALFGDGSDLQIFHTGSSGWIRDLGTGGLVIDTDGTAIDIKGSSPTEYMARFLKDGAVTLYHNNSAKLATTATGVDVTGTVSATTVDLGNWTVTESSGVLYFATGGVNKMKLDATGNLTVVGNVTAYGTI